MNDEANELAGDDESADGYWLLVVTNLCFLRMVQTSIIHTNVRVIKMAMRAGTREMTANTKDREVQKRL